MSRYSHAQKVSQLFKERVFDTKAVFKGLADKLEFKHLTDDFWHIGPDTKGIMKEARKGLEASSKHLHNEVKALRHSVHKMKEKMSELREKFHHDSSPEQSESDGWMQVQVVTYSKAAPAVPMENCALIGVQSAELVFEAHP